MRGAVAISPTRGAPSDILPTAGISAPTPASMPTSFFLPEILPARTFHPTSMAAAAREEQQWSSSSWPQQNDTNHFLGTTTSSIQQQNHLTVTNNSDYQNSSAAFARRRDDTAAVSNGDTPNKTSNEDLSTSS